MLFGKNKKNAEYIVDVHCHIMPGCELWSAKTKSCN